MLEVIMVFGFLACFIVSFFIAKILYKKFISSGKSKSVSGLVAILGYGLVTVFLLIIFVLLFPMEKYKAEDNVAAQQKVLDEKSKKEDQELKVKQQQEAQAKANEEKDRSVMAGMICKNHVKASLKSPATADFPMFDKNIWKMPSQRYVVKSYVDAQNAFGANLRARWFCEIRYKGPGDDANDANWELIKVSLDE